MKFAVIASLLLSILATILFFGQKLGISVFLFVLCFLCITIYILEKYRKIKNAKGFWLLIPIILLSATYGIYQNKFFEVTNIFVMLVLYNIMLLWTMSSKYQLEFVVQRIITLLLKPWNHLKQATSGFGRVFQTKKSKKERIVTRAYQSKGQNTGTRGKSISQIGIGIAVSLPILIVVIILLSYADDSFAKAMGNIFLGLLKNLHLLCNFKFCFETIGRILMISTLSIYFLCFMINLVSRKPWKDKPERKRSIQIEATILNTVVTILNIIYFVFCKIQITNVFAKMVTNHGIDYASYAREGFFQLMIVTIINFIMIIVTTKNENPSSKVQIYYRKIMNIILAAATCIMLGSAFIKMNLYGQEFGYTFLRILVYFALITESILMLPTIIYILKDKFSPWKSYLVIITVMYVVMNFSNINKMIAQKNVKRYLNNQTTKMDISYLTKTRTDGIEEAIKLYEQIQDENMKKQLERYFVSLKKGLTEKEYVTEWNYSKWKARTLLDQF